METGAWSLEKPNLSHPTDRLHLEHVINRACLQGTLASFRPWWNLASKQGNKQANNTGYISLLVNTPMHHRPMNYEHFCCTIFNSSILQYRTEHLLGQVFVHTKHKGKYSFKAIQPNHNQSFAQRSMCLSRSILLVKVVQPALRFCVFFSRVRKCSCDLNDGICFILSQLSIVLDLLT
jgi:hypothetical protein